MFHFSYNNIKIEVFILKKDLNYIFSWCGYHTTFKLVFPFLKSSYTFFFFIQITSIWVSSAVVLRKPEKDEIAKYQKSSSKHVLPVFWFNQNLEISLKSQSSTTHRIRENGVIFLRHN